jgi:hypothetical protein
MKTQNQNSAIRRKNNSEVLTSNINRELDINKNDNKIHEENSKDNIFLESFSDITKKQIVDTLNINLEETSVIENNFFVKSAQKTTNKTLIKIISTKFHDLYLKLVNQIKCLKIENNNLKKKWSKGSRDIKDSKDKLRSGINFILI